MSNEVLLIGVPIGILGFLFLLWRKLKDDYMGSQIFSFGFIIVGFLLAGFLLGNFISNAYSLSTSVFNDDGLWFWLAFIFALIGFTVGFATQKGGKEFKPRFYELIEGSSRGFIFFLIPIFFVSSIANESLKTLLFTIFLSILLYLYFFFTKHYKRFTWYKSGKVGFASLATLGIFFLVRTLVAIIDPSMLSFMGKFDAVISVLVSFAFFISLYKLSEKI